ncbi:MAG: TonB-dependent receptor, partial [Novosphingobium sp.]|nr:TonB-dependent receptor [Novosphingobium sp.]
AEQLYTGNEIIVTATKREVTLQDVPVAVSVTTADTIEKAQIRDINDLVTVVPALRVVQLQSSAATNFFIRGFGNGSNNLGIEPSVGVFVDGIYRSRTASQIGDFPDIERIEVLRGPQSTLFGKNASAGVVSLITKKPQYQFSGSMEATYGNFDAYTAKGYITGPLGEHVAASLAGGFNRRDGFVHNLGTGGDTSDRNRWFVRGQALVEPSDDLSIRLIADYDKIDEECCSVINLQSSAATAALMAVGGQVTDPAHPYADITYSNFPPVNKIENYGFSGQIEYQAGPVKLTSITAYRWTDAFTNQDSDFSSARLLGSNLQDQSMRTFTQELRATADINDRLSVLVGAFYLRDRIRQRNELYLDSAFRPYADLLVQGGSGGALNVPMLEQTFGALEGDPGKYTGTFFTPGSGLEEAYRLKGEAFSVFGQLDFEIVDRLTLTLGGNFTSDRKRYRTNTTSNDVFSAVDLDSAIYAPFREQLLVGAGLLNAGVNPNDMAAVTAFATDPATAPIYQQIAAFAAANQNNPLANPLGSLRSLQLFPPFLNVPNAVENGKTKDNDFSYTIRLAYDVSPDFNVYASYATGFKASSINLSRDSRPPAAAFGDLATAGLILPNLRAGTRYAGPEESRVIEFGAKGTWGGYSANVALFHQEIKGFQSNIFTGTGFALANAGKQSTYGVEFDGTARPIKPLTLGLSVVWLDPKYDSFEFSAVGDQTGRRPPEIPEWSITLSGQWDQELNNGDHVVLRAAYHYESSAWSVEGLPGFITRDAAGNVISYQSAIDAAGQFKRQVDELAASLTYAMGNGVELSVWGRNLLNDRYMNRIFDSVAQPRAISGYINVPRTYGVAARVKW